MARASLEINKDGYFNNDLMKLQILKKDILIHRVFDNAPSIVKFWMMFQMLMHVQEDNGGHNLGRTCPEVGR